MSRIVPEPPPLRRAVPRRTGGPGDRNIGWAIQGRRVSAAAPVEGDTLVWNADAEEWQPGTGAGGGGAGASGTDFAVHDGSGWTSFAGLTLTETPIILVQGGNPVDLTVAGAKLHASVGWAGTNVWGHLAGHVAVQVTDATEAVPTSEIESELRDEFVQEWAAELGATIPEQRETLYPWVNGRLECLTDGTAALLVRSGGLFFGNGQFANIDPTDASLVQLGDDKTLTDGDSYVLYFTANFSVQEVI